MTSALPRPQKLDALTSLRFFAAAMIVVGHAHPLFGSLGFATAVPYSQGVSFFFVLSGFILAYNYPILEGRNALKRFWLARVARVWPLHTVMLLLWIALIFKFDRQSNFPGVEGLVKLVANVLLLQAWVPLRSWSLSFNEVAWSLSVEFFFYAAFPLLIRYWARSWHWLLLVQAGIVVLVIAICSALALPSADTYPGVGFASLIYLNPLVRLLEFSVGISTAFLVRKIPTQELGLTSEQWFVLELTAIGSCAFALLAAANLLGIQHVLGAAAVHYFTREGLWLFFAMLIGIFALSRGPVRKLLTTRVMVFLGEISFALYLCHALILYYIQPYQDILREGGGVAYTLFWTASLLCSALLFYGIEQPARKMILKMGHGDRRVDHSKVESKGRKMVPAIAMLGLIGTVVVAVFFRPSMLIHLDEKNINSFLSSSGTHALVSAATFDKRYQILGLRAESKGNDEVALQVLMRAAQDVKAHDIAALHLNDRQGAMFDAPGDIVIDSGPRIIPAGTAWVQRFITTYQQYEKTHSVGIAIYKNPTALYEVVGGASDWSGRRLILPKVPVSLAAGTAP